MDREREIEKLKTEILELESDLHDQEEAIPAHTIRPHQIIALEEIEDAIAEKKQQLDKLLLTETDIS